MAGKFKIFCDDCPQQPQLEPARDVGPQKPVLIEAASRKLDAHQPDEQEKLAILRQQAQSLVASAASNLAGGQPLKREPLGLRQQLTQVVQAQPEPSNAPSSLATSTSLSEEDQENDISMASLGSDFVPSILHDEDFDRSFDVEEDEEHGASSGGNLADFRSAEDFEGDYDLDDEDQDGFDEDDEELQMELSQAFKQHDESQLYKSAVYNNDIKSYLLELERSSEFRPIPNYLDYQKELDSDKRAILINWLVEVSDEYNMQTETLFICITLIDRFLSKMSVTTSNLQLLGVAAMFIASKYEEIYPPDLRQFVEVTDDTYSDRQILQMEQAILKTLNFRISSPTISYFLTQIFAFNKFSKKVYHLAEYLCYLSLLFDQPFLEYYPSEIALASVILAANQLDMASSISTDLKIAYDKSNLNQLQRRVNSQLPFCIESLRTIQDRAHSKSTRLHTDTAIVHKFSADSYDNVSSIRPPKVDDLLAY